MKHPLVFMCAILLTQAVTAEQFCNPAIPTSTPDSRFTVNGDEVTDKETGLIWQRCSLGQDGNDCTTGNANTYSWQEALQAAEIERDATGKEWRLPNIKELRSIVEEKCESPAINLTIFPNVTGSYWSASWFFEDFLEYYAWTVSFDGGEPWRDSKTYSKPIRLVRDP